LPVSAVSNGGVHLGFDLSHCVSFFDSFSIAQNPGNHKGVCATLSTVTRYREFQLRM
jgi:hypothetical protein